MPDILTPAPADAVIEQIKLIFEDAGTDGPLLRPIEMGSAYYGLLQVQYQAPADPAALPGAPSTEWLDLEPAYLLEQTTQTLRWAEEPGCFHVGRLPEAKAFRVGGEAHAYSPEEFLAYLASGPIAFRGYPYEAAGRQHMQLLPRQPDEEYSEPLTWNELTLWLRPGAVLVRQGERYQYYEGVYADGRPTGECYIGHRTGAGEWFTPHVQAVVAELGDWTRLVIAGEPT